jgi:2-(1,2-epoxy-1,2-dihydrophenyl)acetyl-CoA isomerase
MYETLIWEVREHTGILTLNRPDRLNAIDTVMRKEIESLMRKVEADPNVWNIVLTGNGRGFCSGADLKARDEEDKTGKANSAAAQPMFETSLYYPLVFGELTKPVIAAVNGVTRGAGCNMAFSADFRIASEKANFGCNFVDRGLMGEMSAFYLPRMVGMAVANEICLLGEPFDAAQAKTWGLVNAVVPHDRLLDEALALAAKLSRKAPLAVRMTKVALHHAFDTTAEHFLDMQNTMNNKLRATADAKEALRAFIEKRPAQFKGE